MNFFIKEPKYIFLLDGLGALFSAFMLGIVLAQWETFFGIPRNFLFMLAWIAIALSCYSLSIYFINPIRRKIFLGMIATANFLYCLLTIYLIFHLFGTITIWGISYFIIEKIVVISLAAFELKTALNSD
ncbi:hypothetical protein [Leptospira idonii]|uniref:Uncharacterized protein n=1 Tax=Leptospira idonii TaxID=1193500 RepID=A0A4R9LZH0_9LEPT|nr:hypothetical protein [Leptospira idonii]TGN19162.1 hypothetical protein EHS15_10405 [Leptospira idonii]